MTVQFDMIPLANLLRPSNVYAEIDPEKNYRLVTVKLWGKGVEIRSEVEGTSIIDAKLFVAKENQFILSKIDARNGAFGLIPSRLNQSVVSTDFPLFDLNTEKVLPDYLNWMSKTKAFVHLCAVASEGTTNRVRLKIDRFLASRISLPSIEEQHRIVARIEELAAKIEEARGLRREAVEEGEKLDISYLSRQFDFSASDILPPYWNWYYLNEILINNNHGITTGPFGTLLQKSEIQLDGIPVVGIANVQKNNFSFGFNDYVSLEKAEELANYKVYADDILIARSGTVGRSCVVPQGLYPDPVMSTNLIRLRLNTQLFLPELLCKLFNGSKLVESYKDAQCYGSTRTFFTQKLLLKLRIPVPPIEQQKQIIMNLNKLQERIKVFSLHQTQTSAELNALLPSILDKAFKGEL